MHSSLIYRHNSPQLATGTDDDRCNSITSDGVLSAGTIPPPQARTIVHATD